ncbi:murein biosynthesis integral membrane protein MurJ [Propionibacteriaceae bacterium G1746]
MPERLFRDDKSGASGRDESWGRPTGAMPSGLFRDEPAAATPPPVVGPSATTPPAAAPRRASGEPAAEQPPRRFVPPVQAEWQDWDQTSVDSTLYVSLNDFFGGSLNKYDPVLDDWRGSEPEHAEHPEPPESPEHPESAAAPAPTADAGWRAPVDPDALTSTVPRPPLTDADLAAEEVRRAGGLGPATPQQPSSDTDGEPTAVPDVAATGEATAVARNSALMASGTLVSRVLGMVRTALLAAAFGVTVMGDAFQVANTLPNYVYILLSAGVLNAVLIPQITKAMKRADGGQAFVDRLLTVSLGLVFVVALLATVAAPLLVRITSNLPPDAYQGAVFYAYLCLPQIAFYGLYAVLGQVLNARGQFAEFMWAPALANVVQIAGLIWFLVAYGEQRPGDVFTAPMMWLLGLSATLGIVLQGLSLIWPLYRGGFRFTPRFDIRGHGLGSASKILGWTFTALVIAQVGGFAVQQVMTTIRGDDERVPSVLAHSQAFQIFILPHSFVTVSILTALFPSMSRAHQDGDSGRMRELLTRSLRMPAVAVIPMSAAMIALAYPIIRVLLPGGGTDHVAVAWILAAMSIGTMAFGITTLQQRYCFAREDGRTNLYLQVLLTVVQISIALFAFAVPQRWGVFTIGLGQSIANIVAAAAFLWVAQRQLGGWALRPVAGLYGRLVAGSVAAGVVAFGLSWAIGQLGSGVGVALVQLVVGGGAFLAVAYVALKKLGVDELDEVLAPVLRRLKRS